MNCSSAEMTKCRDVLIQVECDQKNRHAFETAYSAITGKAPKGDSFVVLSSLKGEFREQFKNGVRIQVYFNAPEVVPANLRALGIDVTRFCGGEFQYCCSDQAFFWKLVRDGFRIGTYQTQPAMA